METNQDRRPNVLDNHLVKALVRCFTHSPRTDMRKKRINNKDMIALCMFAYGPMTARDLREVALAWRGVRAGKKVLDSYFIPHYGHTASSLTGHARYGGPYSNARCSRLWYRATETKRRVTFPGCVQPMRRYTNDLTVQGVARCRSLLALPND